MDRNRRVVRDAFPASTPSQDRVFIAALRTNTRVKDIQRFRRIYERLQRVRGIWIQEPSVEPEDVFRSEAAEIAYAQNVNGVRIDEGVITQLRYWVDPQDALIDLTNNNYRLFRLPRISSESPEHESSALAKPFTCPGCRAVDTSYGDAINERTNPCYALVEATDRVKSLNRAIAAADQTSKETIAQLRHDVNAVQLESKTKEEEYINRMEECNTLTLKVKTVQLQLQQMQDLIIKKNADFIEETIKHQQAIAAAQREAAISRKNTQEIIDNIERDKQVQEAEINRQKQKLIASSLTQTNVQQNEASVLHTRKNKIFSMNARAEGETVMTTNEKEIADTSASKKKDEIEEIEKKMNLKKLHVDVQEKTCKERNNKKRKLDQFEKDRPKKKKSKKKKPKKKKECVYDNIEMSRKFCAIELAWDKDDTLKGQNVYFYCPRCVRPFATQQQMKRHCKSGCIFDKERRKKEKAARKEEAELEKKCETNSV